jgi:hypothetical protein
MICRRIFTTKLKQCRLTRNRSRSRMRKKDSIKLDKDIRGLAIDDEDLKHLTGLDRWLGVTFFCYLNEHLSTDHRCKIESHEVSLSYNMLFSLACFQRQTERSLSFTMQGAARV